MTLKELLLKVQEKSLTREQLEEYRDNVSNLYSLMQIELADVRKEKALYWLDHPGKTDIGTERKWQVSKSGLREIELTHYIKATEKLLSSLKSRIYDKIY